MTRAAREQLRTRAVWRQHLAQHRPDDPLCRCEQQMGRFRKGQRRGGCGTARCWLCHGEKLANIQTRSQRRAQLTYVEGLLEALEDAEYA